jgi:serine/threonine-protein kinase
MGEVYRARDTRLNRDVAIKVSQERFSDRFEREARAVAALNHPNICTLFDVGPNYVVMELIDGESPKGPLPLDETLRIMRQIADALDAAHEKGIIHRDLKPGNIKIKPNGMVKVLDFGLAKNVELISGDPETSPTLTASPTHAGEIMGTAAYMSPEQACGKAVDKRADIWAFGVVFYELLTGRRPFHGEGLTATLASVMKDRPDLGSVPIQARSVLERCLEKDPKKRLRDIGDAWIAIDGAAASEMPPTDTGNRGLLLAWGIAAALAVGLGIVGLVEWRRGPLSDRGPVTRLTMELSPSKGLNPDGFGRPNFNAIAITPDGSTVIFCALDPGDASGTDKFWRLYRRAIDQMESVAIPGTEGAIVIFLKPDGQWVGFWADGKLEKVSLKGGPPFTICEAGVPWGASWSSADTIIFAGILGDLMQVPAKGGTPQVFLKRDPSRGEMYSTPAFLPDGKTLLYTVRTSQNWDEAQIVARRLDTGEQNPLIRGGRMRVMFPLDTLLYMHNAVLMAQQFDAHRIQVVGSPVAMLEGVLQAVNVPNLGRKTGMGEFAISSSGSLIYAAGGTYPPQVGKLLRVDRNGNEFELDAPNGSYQNPRVSPDGLKLAVVKREEKQRGGNIWVLDLFAQSWKRLTADGYDINPVWSPDGKRVLFNSATEINSIAADGSDVGEVIFSADPGEPTSWSADGKIAYIERSGHPWQIWTRPVLGNAAPEPFADSKFSFTDAHFSPDGHWMAYNSVETDRNEIWVRAFPPVGEKYRISSNGGINVVWGRNQRELFYLAPTPSDKVQVMGVDIAPVPPFKSGRPHQLFEGSYQTTGPTGNFDVTPDSQHFILCRDVTPPPQLISKLTVVLNCSTNCGGEHLKRNNQQTESRSIVGKPLFAPFGRSANSNALPPDRAKLHCTRPFCCGSPLVG